MESFDRHCFSPNFNKITSLRSQSRITSKSRSSEIIRNKQTNIQFQGEIGSIIIMEDSFINKKVMIVL